MLRFVALFVLLSILLGVNVNAAPSLIDSSDLDNFVEDMPVMLLGDSLTDADVTYSYYMSTVDGHYFNTGNQKSFPEDWSYSEFYLVTSVTLNAAIPNGDTFDISLRSQVHGESSIGSCYVALFDSNWNSIISYGSVNNADKFTLTFSNGEPRYYISGLKASGKAVSYIRLFQKISIDAPCDIDFSSSNFNLSIISESGKLSNILDTIKNIFTSITNLPANIANSIKGFFDNVVNAVNKVFTAISELPAKIWNLIETGLKNLFVPTEEDLQEYYDKWDVLMSERFGALYEVVNIVTDFIDSFKSYNETGTIDFPAVTVDLAGSPFTFGGWTVDIVPDGFGLLFDSLKLAVDMVCTYAFVFGMKKRYEDLVERG